MYANARALKHALQLARSAAEVKGAHPIRQFCRFTREGAALVVRVASSDGSVMARVPLHAQANDDRAAQVDGLPALDVLVSSIQAQRLMPRGAAVGTLPLELNGGRVLLAGVALDTYPARDYPVPVREWRPVGGAFLVGEVEIRPAVLRDALEYTITAASTDNTRCHIYTVHWAGCELLATDGHRVHVADVPEAPAHPVDGWTLPLGAARGLAQAAGFATHKAATPWKVRFYVDELKAKAIGARDPEPFAWVAASNGELSVYTPCVPVRVPRYHEGMGEVPPVKIVFQPGWLAGWLGAITGKEWPVIVFKVTAESILLRAGDDKIDFDKAPAQVHGDVPEGGITWKCNGGYLFQAIRGAHKAAEGERPTLALLADPRAPGHVLGHGYAAAVMPINT